MTRRRHVGIPKDRRSAEQRNKELWDAVRQYHLTRRRDDHRIREDALKKMSKNLEKSTGNIFTARLSLLAYCTRSMKFFSALEELFELGLDGPDWEDRLGPMLQRHRLNDELSLLISRFDLPLIDAVQAFALGETQRGVARQLAVSYPMSNSYEAAVQRTRIWLRTEDSVVHRLLRLLNDIPVRERRRGLEYARARYPIRGDEIQNALGAICDVLRVYHKVDNKALAKLASEGADKTDDCEGDILEFLEGPS